jgi:outer membrane protein OmpA-like peptidoglycan-associated protein
MHGAKKALANKKGKVYKVTGIGGISIKSKKQEFYEGGIMRSFSAILLVVVMVVAMAAAPASAGYKDQWAKFRTTMTDRADSKIVCFTVMPWPWKCACAPAPPPPPPPPPPVDSDGDGVYDDKDECPNTPRGATVDARGCPSDSDQDGVFDGIDQCPGTPRGATVDARGCPSDSDNDGVLNGIDKCPNTPAGAKVDEWGCTIEAKQFLDTGLITTTAILFDFDKATLKPESKNELDRIGAILIQAVDLAIEIGGHTDSKGSDKYNLKLSDERAKAVRDYLVANFPQIKPDNLVSKGYGEGTPVATNKTDAGRAQNRRVEFKIIR